MREEQVLYLGRWVPKRHFKAFVYNKSGQILANSYREFKQLISSGVWFADKESISEQEGCDEAEMDNMGSVAQYFNENITQEGLVKCLCESKVNQNSPKKENKRYVMTQASKVKKCRNQPKP